MISQAPDLSKVRLVAWDLETFKIGKHEPFPYPVCCSIASRPDGPLGEIKGELLHAYFDRDRLIARLTELLTDPRVMLVSQNGATYDSTVIARAFPELSPLIFEQADRLHIFDTMIAHKMILNANSGNPDEEGAGLDELVSMYIGDDISKTKGAEAVRVRYSEVWNLPIGEWPDEFRRYSVFDAGYTLAVAEAMLKRPEFPQILRAVCHRSRAMVYQARKTLHGCAVDKPRVAELYQEALDGYDFTRYPELLSEGILIPAKDPEPYARGVKAHEPGCANPKTCDCPPKMKSATPAKTSPSALQRLLFDWSIKHGVPANLTKSARDRAKEQGIESFDGSAEVRSWDFRLASPFTSKDIATGREDCEQFDAVLEKVTGERSAILNQWVLVNKYDKLANTYLPRFIWDDGNDCQGSHSLKWKSGKKVRKGMKSVGPPDEWSETCMDLHWVDTIRFASNALVATGRFSGRGTSLFPSLNGQNLPRDLGVRECLVARPGHVYVAVDFNALELCAAAWRVFGIYGQSTLYDLILAGHDTHSFLAAQLVYHMDSNQTDVFESGRDMTCCLRRMEQFLALKKTNQDYFKHWRTFAKPVGLGILGGMGPARIQEVAWKTYKIAITIEEATQARDVWRDLMPYENLYLKEYIKAHLPSTRHEGRYSYTSPLGMVRENASWSAAANGDVLQTPSAEGMAEAICRVVRECEDWTLGSVLYGCRVVDDVHDEILTEVPWDEHLDERVDRIEKIMQESMEDILEGVPIRTEAAVMLRYSKNAYLARDEKGKLKPYDATA